MNHSKLMLALALAAGLLAADAPDKADALARIRRHIRPLAHPLGDRLPMVVWQNRHLPMGLETKTVPEVQSVYVDRGFLPLCNLCGSVAGAQRHLPVLKYWQSRGLPVCILPQGWVQSEFHVDRKGRSKCPHQKPADPGHKFPCPSAMKTSRRVDPGAKRTRDVLKCLKDAGVDVKLLLIDFESGAYLRNTGDREDRVRGQAAMALKCPRCVKMFTEEALASPAGYAKVVDEVRAESTRRILCDPAREVFPHLHIGNYYAWPINRVPRPEDRWPAYGYEGSGMNVAMPRVYMNAGWGGAGRDQDKMDQSAFHCCLAGFSPAASVLREGELLIPWTHVWLGGRYLKFAMQGRKLPAPWAMSEAACHMMLRGAETFAIWMDAQIGEFPTDYPYPKYADMGQFVYDVKGIQEGFGHMLQFHAFLRRAKPMTFDVPGERAKLGPDTATWSGMKTDERALVRTIVFDQGRSHTKALPVFGRTVSLAFGPRGRDYWIYPDGRVEPAGE